MTPARERRAGPDRRGEGKRYAGASSQGGEQQTRTGRATAGGAGDGGGEMAQNEGGWETGIGRWGVFETCMCGPNEWERVR